MPYVVNEYGKLKKVLLSAPDFLSIDVPLNVITQGHKDKGNSLSLQRACDEHKEFVSIFESYDIEVLMGQTSPRCVYTLNPRDLGVTTEKGIIFGRYVREVRWGEERLAEKALYANKVPIFYKLDRGTFEGGDFMYADKNLAFVGHGCRTNPLGIKALELALFDTDIEIIPIDFDEVYLHLDMICNVVGEKTVVLYKEALPDYIINIFHKKKFELIEVTKEEVFLHGCNLLSIGSDTIISHIQAENTNKKLRALGFNVEVANFKEVLKSGGGPRCMSFPIERE